MFSYGVDVTVERAEKGKHGVPLDPELHDLPSCVLAPGGTSEQIVDSAQVTWDVDLLTTDPAADVRPHDVVLVPVGSPYVGRYQVTGMPKFYRSPWTGQGGTLVQLKGVSG